MYHRRAVDRLRTINPPSQLSTTDNFKQKTRNMSLIVVIIIIMLKSIEKYQKKLKARIISS